MARFPNMLHRKAAICLLFGLVALFFTVQFLDREFWAESVRSRGGAIRTTSNGDVYLVALNSPAFDDSDVEIASRIPTLEQLLLVGSDVTDQALVSISQVDSLKHLDVSNTGITDSELSRLSGLPGLEFLEFNNCGNVTGAGLLQLRPMPNLHQLGIRGTEISFVELQQLKAQLPASTAIEVDPHAVLGIRNSGNSLLAQWNNSRNGIELFCQFVVTPEWIERLRSPEAVIRLSTQAMTPDAVVAMERCVRLQNLQVDGCDDRGANALANCTELQSLVLLKSSLTDTGLQDLSRLQHLSSLHLSSPDILGHSFAALGNLSELQSLTLKCSNADAEQTAIALASLAELSHLEALTLTLPFTSASDLNQLRNCAELSNLSLENCGLSDSHIIDLVPLPTVRVLRLAGNPLTG